MIQIDSLTVKIPVDNIVSLNDKVFETNKKSFLIPDTDCLREIETKKINESVKKPLGLNSIYTNNHTVDFQVSAKILKDGYFDMINLNTLDRLESEINNSGFIKIKKDSLYNDGICQKADLTKNLKMTKPIPEYITALESFDIHNRHYETKQYKNEGIVFQKEVKTRNLRDRFILYDKKPELIKDTKLLEYINPKQFDGILRFENNLRSNNMFRRLIKVNHTGNISLKEVLESKENPCLENFKNVFGKNPVKPIQTSFYDNKLFGIVNSVKLKGKQKEKRIGILGIVEFFNYNLNSIKTYLESNYITRVQRYRKFVEYRNFIKEIKNTDVRISENKYISEIIHALETA